MKKEHEILFEPFKIGTVMIKNRFVLEPMEGTNMIDCLPMATIYTRTVPADITAGTETVLRTPSFAPVLFFL